MWSLDASWSGLELHSAWTIFSLSRFQLIDSIFPELISHRGADRFWQPRAEKTQTVVVYSTWCSRKCNLYLTVIFLILLMVLKTPTLLDLLIDIL